MIGSFASLGKFYIIFQKPSTKPPRDTGNLSSHVNFLLTNKSGNVINQGEYSDTSVGSRKTLISGCSRSGSCGGFLGYLLGNGGWDRGVDWPPAFKCGLRTLGDSGSVVYGDGQKWMCSWGVRLFREWTFFVVSETFAFLALLKLVFEITLKKV